ncbi:MAG: RAD55 family ATPase [Candidatus Bathyarchaeia archaeon]
MTILAADRSMRSKAVLLVLIVALATSQPQLHLASADATTIQITLYAHTDPSAVSAQGRVLSLIGNTTTQHRDDLREGLNFTLVPSLSAPLHLLGGIDVYVWLGSQQNVRGEVRVAISELKANGSLTEIVSASVNIVVPSFPYLVIFGLGPTDYRVSSGSALRLDVRFSSNAGVPVNLLWDTPSTSTRVVLDVETTPIVDLKVTDAAGRASTIFPENDTKMADLTARVTIEDPFRGVNIRTALLTVTNSSGFPLLKDVPMNLTSQTETPFRLEYALPITIPAGHFNFTVSVGDVSHRVFTTSTRVTITNFYTLTIMLLDSKSKPLPGVDISLFVGDQLIGEPQTDLTGMMASRVPSSLDTGPLILRAQKNGIVILSRTVEVQSDVTLQIVVPLYDWNFAVRLQQLSIPVMGAQVSLYLNGTSVASGSSDQNGIVHFAALPLGSYEVKVASLIGVSDFVNVTHSGDQSVTALELPIPWQILVIAGVAIFAILGAWTVSRRRTRRRSYKQVAELLGGTIPERAVMMVVGASGSGKSLLMLNILADSLLLGRRCVYVSNMELPSKIRDQLTRIGVNVRDSEHENTLRFIDAYTGETGTGSSEMHTVSSPRDLTGLGIQITSCIEELAGTADVFFDSLTPVVESGGPARGLEFVQYYGARTTKSGGNFVYATTATIGDELVGRLEEASDCVVQIEKMPGRGKVRGRLLVKKARGLEHEEDWVGFKITSKGRMEFVSLPSAQS